MTRAYLISLMAALAVVALAAGAVSLYTLVQFGRVAPGTLGVLLVSFGCLFVLTGLLVMEPRAGASPAPSCRNCGARVFATLRSLDRREVLTCFMCGLEWVLPPLARK